MDKFEEIKNRLSVTQVIEFYTNARADSHGKILCPFHKDKNPSLSIKESEKMWKCFACDIGGDIVSFVARLKSLQNKEALELMCQDFRIDLSKPAPLKIHKAKPLPPPKPKMDIPKYCAECHKNATLTDYFTRRGLTEATVKRFTLGYDAELKAAVLPYNTQLNYFQRRYIEYRRFEKPETEQYGDEPLWNPNALQLRTRKPVFVVESPICAMSIMQVGGQAVSFCGSNYNKLFKALEKPPRGALILCLDNDEAGVKKLDKIRAWLDAKKILYLVKNIADECNDPNELLVAKPTKFARNVEQAEQDGWLLKRDKYDSEDFSDILDKKIEPRTWLVEGLISTGLTLLAAPPKIGKSFMMLQLMQCVLEGTDFLGMKCHRHEVEYMALEDDERRIIERGRLQRKGKAKPSRGAHISLKAPTMDRNALLDVIAEKLERFPKIKLFIIDTLQKVRRTKTVTTKADYQVDYDEIGYLKEFADDNKISIIVIHHTRKMVDEVDPFNNILGNTALQGAVDSMLVINNRKTEQIIMHCKGRDIENNALVIDLDDNKKGGTFMWKLVGTPEQQAELARLHQYENNPIVVTIKKLLEMHPSGWGGSSTDLINQIYDITGRVVVANAGQVGKELSLLSSSLYRDGIVHQKGRNSSKREHFFTYKANMAKNMPPVHQQSLIDNDS